jgi:hypothetical protein
MRIDQDPSKTGHDILSITHYQSFAEVAQELLDYQSCPTLTAKARLTSIGQTCGGEIRRLVEAVIPPAEAERHHTCAVA